MDEDIQSFRMIGTLELSDDGGLVIRIPAEVVAESKLKAGGRMDLDLRPWFLDDPTHLYYEDPNKNPLDGLVREEWEAFIEAASAYEEDFVNG